MKNLLKIMKTGNFRWCKHGWWQQVKFIKVSNELKFGILMI